MKLFVLTSCSKIMTIKQEHGLTCDDLNAPDKIDYQLRAGSQKKKARDLFRGPLNISVNAAVDQLRKHFGVCFYILSAGFGLLNEDDKIPPHNCSFSDMSDEEIRTYAMNLGIPEKFKTLIENEQPDFIFLALKPQYLCALGDWEEVISCPTIAYQPSQSKYVISLPEDHLPREESMRMGGLPFRGPVSFRDDLLLLTKRYITNSSNPEQALKEIIAKPNELLYLLDSIRKHGL